jgi:hypothetical protein
LSNCGTDCIENRKAVLVPRAVFRIWLKFWYPNGANSSMTTENSGLFLALPLVFALVAFADDQLDVLQQHFAKSVLCRISDQDGLWLGCPQRVDRVVDGCDTRRRCSRVTPTVEGTSQNAVRPHARATMAAARRKTTVSWCVIQKLQSNMAKNSRSAVAP